MACAFLGIVFYIRWCRGRGNPKRLPLPPGPSPLPIIGNLHQVPRDHDWLRYTEWFGEYGPLVYFRLFRQPVILINTRQAACDLLEKRSSIYSDRPNDFIMAELIGWNQGVTLSAFGPRHRKYRKLLNSTLNSTAARRLWPIQESGVYRFLVRLADDPDHFYEHIRTSVSETIVMITFGQECSKDSFPYSEMAERTQHAFSAATSPYTYTVDILPILRYLPEWFPGAKFKRDARIWNEQLQELVHYPYRAVKEDLASGRARPSFVARHIDTKEQLSKEDDTDIMWTAASLYTGGVDTTTAAVTTFILTMCLHPHVQTKAQQELDTVIGAGRLPQLADRESLPYVNACVREMLRLYPVAPLGFAHLASEDDYYDGYHIPKGTTLISNIWAMSHDPTIYKDPEEFKPERFLSTQAAGMSNKESTLPFGFGRRICPGMHMADSSLFLYVARTLSTFNITKATGVDGRPVEPEVEFVSGLISHPKPFKCSITIRSSAAAKLLGRTT
ncbi:cytochrome P450 [Gautieria morchelliformis]|nr:cytochrome P450 [Gautieria morchelliformis]